SSCTNKGAQSCLLWQTVDGTSEGVGGASPSGGCSIHVGCYRDHLQTTACSQPADKVGVRPLLGEASEPRSETCSIRRSGLRSWVLTLLDCPSGVPLAGCSSELARFPWSERSASI